MKFKLWSVLGMGAIGLVAGCAPAGTPAPIFTGLGSDGEFYSMLDLTKTGPIVVVFLSGEDPKGFEILEAASQVQDAFPSRTIRFVGIVGVPVAGFDNWRARVAPSIPSIPDPDRRFAQAYKAQVSPTWQLIGRRGVLVGEPVLGFTDTAIEQVAESIMAYTGVKRQRGIPRPGAGRGGDPSLVAPEPRSGNEAQR